MYLYSAAVDVGFELQALTVSEGSGLVEVCVLVLGALERPLSFEVVVKAGSAGRVCMYMYVYS